MLKFLKLFFVFLIVISANAQTDASIVLDTFQFKLAEEVKIKLIVNSEPNVKIDFPSKNSFRPFEIINQSEIDTVLSDNRLTYIKNYSLIIFDSGTYYIPKQKLLINDKPFYTDSVKVVVNDVVVDTVEQSLYPIKTILSGSGTSLRCRGRTAASTARTSPRSPRSSPRSRSSTWRRT